MKMLCQNFPYGKKRMYKMKKIIVSFFIFFTILTFATTESATLAENPSSSEGHDGERELDFAVSAQLAMSSNDYMVTAGDVYTLAYAVASNFVTYTIPVDSSYKIRVSNLAIIDAKGKSYLQLKKQVEDIVTKNYPMSGVQFILAQPAIFKVQLIGEVKTSLVKQCWSVTRLSTVLAGNLTDFSSTRNIEITSLDGTKKTYDLFKASRFGDFSQNPYVRPDDVITVKKLDRKVSISGAVKRPGTYDLLEGENLESLINLYGDGLRPLADTTRVELRRPLSNLNSSGELIYLKQEQLNSNEFLLTCYDSIHIPSLSELKSVMFIEGAIGAVGADISSVANTNKIPVEFEFGENYATLIRRLRHSFAFQADKKNAYIIKENATIIPIDIDEILYNKDFYSKHYVESNDLLVVPFKQYFVTVAGAVKNPGRYPYLPDRSWEYYIGLAGGFDELKNKGQKIDIRNKEGIKIGLSDKIEPETTITAKANSFTYYFNQYSPFVATILSLVTTTITLYNVMK